MKICTGAAGNRKLQTCSQFASRIDGLLASVSKDLNSNIIFSSRSACRRFILILLTLAEGALEDCASVLPVRGPRCTCWKPAYAHPHLERRSPAPSVCWPLSSSPRALWALAADVIQTEAQGRKKLRVSWKLHLQVAHLWHSFPPASSAETGKAPSFGDGPQQELSSRLLEPKWLRRE